MNRLDTPLIRFLKYLTAVLLMAVVAVVAVNFILQSRNRTPVETQERENFDAGRVEEKEQIRHMEEEKGRAVMEFEAGRHYLGQDGYYHLEGSVEVAFPQSGQDNVRFFGEEVVHDEEEEWFRVKGGARIQFKDGALEAPSLEYDVKKGIVTGSGEVVYQSGRLNGRADTIQWKVKRKEIFLKKNVYLEMIPEREGSPTIRINCDEIEYLRKWGHGFLRGNVNVAIDNNRLQAEKMEFRLTAGREFLRSVKMKGKAMIILSGEKSRDSSSETYESLEDFLNEGEKHFQSDEIFMVFFHDTAKIQELRSRNGCDVFARSQTGDSFRLSSETLRFRLNPAGGLKEFKAQGDVHLAEQREGIESFRISADILQIKDRKNVLEIFRGKQESAKAAASGFEVWGSKMEYYLNNRNLKVKEGAEVVLETSGSNNPGFFSSSEPLFIKSEQMRYLPSKQRFLFTGKTKFWQKKAELESGDLILDKESGKVIAENGVRSVFHYTPEGGNSEKRVEIKAQRMVYRPYQNDILFKEDGSFSLAGAELKAEEIILLLGREDRSMQGFQAHTGVTVEHGSYEAQSERAYFDAESNQIVLTGNPVLKEKNRGSTQGDKLTFSLSDDKIFVENQGRERSLTVIK